uniref:Uncharacterized protein n=1 Tax=Acrobeloides nanus TaxID=290746 RepID=A0A914EP48_9BILA
MFAFATVPSILQFIGYWYLPETPRFAFERDGVDTCEKLSNDTKIIGIGCRRTLLIASVTGTGISLLLMGFSFLMMSKTSAAVRQQLSSRRVDPWTNTSAENFDVCNDYENCDICVTDERCGFCARHGDESQIGYCLPSDLENPGLFFIYTGATFIGLIFFIFMIPETKDVSIANVELLFMDEDERMKSHVDLNQDPHMRKMLDETLERIKRF